MSERPCKILILDHDPDVLTCLQHVLENAGLDTTITWNDVEARELAQNTAFEVILVGNRPRQFSAKTFLYAIKPSPRACLLLGARESKAKPLRRPGISGVVPKRDAHRVLQIVQEHLRSEGVGAESASAAW